MFINIIINITILWNIRYPGQCRSRPPGPQITRKSMGHAAGTKWIKSVHNESEKKEVHREKNGSSNLNSEFLIHKL